MTDYDTETAGEIAASQARLTTLKTMRSSGVLMTRHGDTMVQFQTISELNKAITAEVKDLRRLKGLNNVPVYIRETDKGL